MNYFAKILIIMQASLSNNYFRLIICYQKEPPAKALLAGMGEGENSL